MATEKWDGPQVGISDSTLIFEVFEGAPEKECILLSRMSMHVAKEDTFSLHVRIFDGLFGVEDSWMQKLIWLNPLSIKIHAQKTAPIIAIDHSVTVEHRHNFEHKIFSQSHCQRFVAE